MKKTKVKKADKTQASEEVDTAQAVDIEDRKQVADKTHRETSQVVEETTQRETKTVADVAEAPDPVAELQAKVEKLEDSLLRAKADYQNFLRRAGIERSEAIRFANAELIKSLLSVTDDFERSLAAKGPSDNLRAVVDGVRLVYENLMKALREQGLEIIEALHKPFNPGVHEAMLQQPSAEHPPGTVVEVIAKGYRLRDRVLRPAKVIVSKAAEAVDANAGKDPGVESNRQKEEESDRKA